MNNIPMGYKLVPVDVDALGQFIRKIDGDNQMGAGALAENIAQWLELDATPIYDEVAEVIESAIFRLETFIEAEREMPIPSMEVLLVAFTRLAQSRAKAGEDE